MNPQYEVTILYEDQLAKGRWRISDRDFGQWQKGAEAECL